LSSLEAGHQAFAHQVRNGEWVSYLLYLPDEFDPMLDWPLIVFLHGGVGRNTSVMKFLPSTPPEIIELEQGIPFIVVSPLLPEGFWPSYLDRVDELVDHLVVSLPIDESRVYLTGASSGSYGAWHYALNYPDRFAAIAPVAASPGLLPTKPVPENICDISGIPIWTFHSEGDRGVPVEMTRAAVEAVEDCGADIRYTEYSDLGHIESIEAAYSTAELYSWFLAYSK
jgi:predicted peptidase